MTISTDQVERDFRSSTLDVEHAETLPPYCYTSADFFGFEREAVFSHDWLCLGRQEEVAQPGDYFTITVHDDPLIVVRGSDDRIRVMSNVCRHRASLLASGSGNCGKSFRCHYHWWTYSTDGRLIGAPEMDKTADFDRGEIRLPQLAVEVWNGFIFANFDHAAPPLAPKLARLEEAIGNYDVEGMVTKAPETLDGVPCNWKVMVENFIESYHSSRLHKGPHDFAPSAAARVAPPWPEDDPACIWGWTPTTHADPGFNPSKRALFPTIETLTDEERQKTMFALVPPLLMIGVNVDHVFWFLGLPDGPARISLRMAYCFPPATYDHPEFELLYEMAVQGVEVFNRDDLLANEGVQVGLKSRFAPRGRYSHQEARLPQFNRWLVSRYRRAAGEHVDPAASGA